MERHKYSYDEVIEKSTEYFNGDDLAASTWANKYALRDSDGNYYENTPTQMFSRMSGEFIRIEDKINEKAVIKKHGKKLSKYYRERTKLTEEYIYNMLMDSSTLFLKGLSCPCLVMNFKLDHCQIASLLKSCLIAMVAFVTQINS